MGKLFKSRIKLNLQVWFLWRKTWLILLIGISSINSEHFKRFYYIKLRQIVVENVASRLSLSHSNNMGGNHVLFYVKHLLFFFSVWFFPFFSLVLVKKPGSKWCVVYLEKVRMNDKSTCLGFDMFHFRINCIICWVLVIHFTSHFMTPTQKMIYLIVCQEHFFPLVLSC